MSNHLHSIQAEIQSLYSTHRVARNSQQRDKFLSPDFKGVLVDPFLLRLERPDVEPGFADPRNCLVFWARPPEHVLKLAGHLQSLLKKAAPSTSTEFCLSYVYLLGYHSEGSFVLVPKKCHSTCTEGSGLTVMLRWMINLPHLPYLLSP